MDGFSEQSEGGGTVKTLPRSDLTILENEETTERWRYVQGKGDSLVLATEDAREGGKEE